MKKYFAVAFLISVITINAQLLEKTAITVAYRYTGRNVLQTGLEFRIGSTHGRSIILGPSLLYSHINHADKFIPEAHIYLSDQGKLFGLSSIPYSIEPRIGITLFNLIFLNTGYAFPIHKEKYFKGVTFGIQFNIAPKHTQFYDPIKIM